MSSQDEKIKSHWRSLQYADSRSYTQMNHPKWLADLGQNWFRDSTIAILDQRTRPHHPFDRVVDLGCGAGDWSLQYLRFAHRITGVDFNESFVAEARRAAEAAGLAERADFHLSDIAEWDDFQDVGLVTIGAVLAYLNPTENDELFCRMSEAQRPGDFAYVRATVLNPGRHPFSTQGGHYRPKSHYRRLFERHGYRPTFETYSTSLATAGAAVRAGLPHRAARIATLGVNATVMGMRFCRRELDYCNWLLRRR